MKLMDKNGRLFGKISVIDVVVVLVVLVMAAALHVKNTSLSHTSRGTWSMTRTTAPAAPWVPSRALRSSPPASSPSCMTARWSAPPPRTA